MSHYECKVCQKPLQYCECPVIDNPDLIALAKESVAGRNTTEAFSEVYERPQSSLEGCDCDICKPDETCTCDESLQVGGTHYGTGIDVFKFSLEREHDCLQHAAIKYIDRHKLKNGRQDIEKAISVLQRILLEQYAE